MYIALLEHEKTIFHTFRHTWPSHDTNILRGTQNLKRRKIAKGKLHATANSKLK